MKVNGTQKGVDQISRAEHEAKWPVLAKMGMNLLNAVRQFIPRIQLKRWTVTA